MTRKGFKSGELMVVLVTLGEELPFEAELLACLSDLPITTLVQNINGEHQPHPGRQNRVLLGSRVIRDKIHELEFEIRPSPSSRTIRARPTCSTQGAGILRADRQRDGVRHHCGIGTISLFLAGKAARWWDRVGGSAISDARRNAALNGIEHTGIPRGQRRSS